MFRTFISILLLATAARAGLRVPAYTAYGDPNPDALHVSSKNGITDWRDPAGQVLWFGEFKAAGPLDCALALRLPKDATTKLQLTVGAQSREFSAIGTGEIQTVKCGEFTIAKAGYVRIALASLNAQGQPAGDLDALILEGPAIENAHFNLDPRRNAASVHLFYPVPNDTQAAWFYNEVTGIEDPVATYYMACGFSRGYFGMQVNSPTERRIIFSIWDAGAGENANDRKGVAEEDRVQLLGKGEGVDASVFGGEGTGGHSHLTYPWKTGSVQRFLVTAEAAGTHTDYSGYWFHPEKKAWMMIASFRAPKDGKLLRGLYSFSENFGGNNGHLVRKALFGPQWIKTPDGEWRELLEASFSHDGTGKDARLDRFMGVEGGRFFLSHGGFVEGFTKYGEKFTRPATAKPPEIALPGTK